MKQLCIVAAIAATALVCGCGDRRSGSIDQSSTQAPTIRIDGSSTVFPAAEAIAEEFQKSKGGKIRVTVGVAGTGGGFKRFLRGETDISNASRPILKEEMDEAKKLGIEYIELPICFDALTIAVHPKNDWCQSIDVVDLKKMWEPSARGKITKWNQIRPEWPDEQFALFGAGSDSGTFDYFTEAIVGKAKASRSDYTASEDDNTLVQGIEGNKFALGYIPFAYFEPNKAKLKALPVKWEKNRIKEPVMPNMENVLAGTYNPLSRPLFVYINRKSADKPEVREFVEFMLAECPKLVKEVHYLPLPESAYELAKKRFKDRQCGTVFGGVPEIGVTADEILKRERKS